MKYVPCIFSLLPRGINTLKTSFQFSAPESDVFRMKNRNIYGRVFCGILLRSYSASHVNAVKILVKTFLKIVCFREKVYFYNLNNLEYVKYYMHDNLV